MSFAVAETSRHSGRPAELYFFRYGSKPDSFFAYTNAEDPITFEGITYEPIPVDRDAVKSSGTLDRSTLNIRMPKTLGLPELFRVYPPSQVVTAVVRQGHIPNPGDDPDFLVVWTGRVINSDRAGNEATLSCEPASTSMRRTGLRQHYQYSCPHQLYGPRCRALKVEYPAVVAEVENSILTLNPGWNGAIAQGKFTGGMVEWDSIVSLEPRTILRVLESNVVLLSGIFRGIERGMPVNMILGCDHTLRDCEQVHSNVRNFGGCAWIPFDSPFGKNPF